MQLMLGKKPLPAATPATLEGGLYEVQQSYRIVLQVLALPETPGQNIYICCVVQVLH
jgi:hypothetical protein